MAIPSGARDSATTHPRPAADGGPLVLSGAHVVLRTGTLEEGQVIDAKLDVIG